MNINERIEMYYQLYDNNGQFDLLPGESINDVVNRELIPQLGGAYIIFDKPKCQGSIIYIGRSGTIKQDGTRKEQGLKK
ncbi:MAG: hypothetical protein HQ510_11290 [Candidatus Marinimicrobia bacterium]|nr:hypothetical protein [Candidatus Neomarinimicrobiota bacterium]